MFSLADRNYVLAKPTSEKNREAYNYAGGNPRYEQQAVDETAKGYPGFQRGALREKA